MLVAIYTTQDGLYVKELNESCEVDEFLEEHNSVEWVEAEDFNWQVANIGVMIDGEVFSPYIGCCSER